MIGVGVGKVDDRFFFVLKKVVMCSVVEGRSEER